MFALCYFFVFLIEALIFFQYIFQIFSLKQKKSTQLLLLCGLYLILYFLSFLNIHWLNTIAFLVLNFLYILLVCDAKWYLALFHASIATTAMGFGELFVYKIISHYVDNFFLDQTYFRNIIILTIFSKILYFSILYLLSHFLSTKKQFDSRNDKTALLLSSVPLTSLCIIFTLISVCKDIKLTHHLDVMISVCSILLMALNILIFAMNSYTQKKNQDFTEMQLLLQKETDSINYYKMLLQQNENQSILIHDIKKHLHSIELLNTNEERDKISDYIHQLTNSSDLQENVQICNHHILNVILCQYKKQCRENHIAFSTDIRTDTINFMSDNDVTSLFSNLLDNAYEAASKFPNSFIELTLSKRSNTPFTVLTLVNSCRKNPFSGSSNELPRTTKAGSAKHGYGLKSIQKVTQKYHGAMQIYFDDNTNTFHAIITLR